MNYKQCEDFLELHKHNEDLDEVQFERLRGKLAEKLCQQSCENVSQKTEECGKMILCLEPLFFPMVTAVYLDKTLKLAGYKVMTYCSAALGDCRNRWKIGGKALSQKSLCQIIEWLQGAAQELEIQVPSRKQIELLVAEMAFVQSDAKVLLWYDFFSMAPKIECVDRYDMAAPELEPHKVTKKSLRKQVFDYGKEKGISLAMAGKDALEGACQTLAMLEPLIQKGLKVEAKHVRAAFEEAYGVDSFCVISHKPLFVLDSAQNEFVAQRLVEDMDDYLSGKQVVLLLGATKKTKIEGLLKTLCPKVSYILTVAPPREDRIPSYELAQEALKCHPGVTAVDSIEEAMEIISMVLPKDGAVLAVGCQELLSQVMAIVNKDIF